MFEILVNVKYKLIEPCEMMLVNNNIDYRSRLIETKILQHINKKIIKVLAKKKHSVCNRLVNFHFVLRVYDVICLLLPWKDGFNVVEKYTSPPKKLFDTTC